MLPAVKAERDGVHLWPEFSNLEVIGNKLSRFAVNRLTLVGLGSVWSVRSDCFSREAKKLFLDTK